MNTSIPKDFQEVTKEDFENAIATQDYRREWFANGVWYVRQFDRKRIGFFDDKQQRYYLGTP